MFIFYDSQFTFFYIFNQLETILNIILKTFIIKINNFTIYKSLWLDDLLMYLN